MDQETLPTINATRVCLRSMSQTDIDPLFAVFSDPRVTRYWSTPPLTDREAAVTLLDEIQNSNRQNPMMKWGVAFLANDLLIGTVTLFNLDLSNGRAELGYALGREHWGHGYMQEALQALLSYAFDVLNLRRLEADVDPRNTASIRTLERLGFQREGFLRERWHVNGEIQDAFFYGLLRREWQKGKN